MKHYYFWGLLCFLFFSSACNASENEYLSPDLQTYGLKGDVLYVAHYTYLEDQQTDESFYVVDRELVFDDETHCLVLDKLDTHSDYDCYDANNPACYYGYKKWKPSECQRDAQGRLLKADINGDIFNWCYSMSGNLDSIRIEDADFGMRMIKFGESVDYYERQAGSGYSTLERTFSDVTYDEQGNWIIRTSTNVVKEAERSFGEGYNEIIKTYHYYESRDITYNEPIDNVFSGCAIDAYFDENHVLRFDDDGNASFDYQDVSMEYVEAERKTKLYDSDGNLVFEGKYYGDLIIGTYKGNKIYLRYWMKNLES